MVTTTELFKNRLEEPGMRNGMMGKVAAALLTIGVAGLTVVLTAQGDEDVTAWKDRVRKLDHAAARNEPPAPVEAPNEPGATATEPVVAQATALGEQAGGVDRKELEKIIGAYLKTHEETKKKEEAKKQAEEAAKGFEVGKDLNFKASWRDGLTFETSDKAFKVHVGGRMQQDWGFVSADEVIESAPSPFGFLQPAPSGIVPASATPPANGDLQDGAIFRRVRLRVDGTAYEVVEWVTEFDFATQAVTGATSAPTDIYFNLTKLPIIGNFRAGHFKEPFGLEDLTSDSHITFMERTTFDEAFIPARNLGVMMYDAPLEERMTWALGVFRSESPTSTAADSGDGEYAATGRLTFLPLYEHEGRYLVHLGVAYSHRNLVNDDDILGITPRARLNRAITTRNGGQAFFVNTGGTTILADTIDLLGVEFATVTGPLSFQAEAFWVELNDVTGVITPAPPTTTAFLDNLNGSDGVRYRGWYAQVSYFLTGESRPYRRATAVFDRPRPWENFFLVREGEHGHGWCLGLGAWELAVRYEMITLDDSGLDLGRLQDVTFAVNWYFNPNFKAQANYIFAHRDVASSESGEDFDADIRILGVRFAYDF
jgi:phosphate-selective porin OprO/OprP